MKLKKAKKKKTRQVDCSFSRSFIKRDRWRVSPFALSFLGLRPPLFRPARETTRRAVSRRWSFHTPSFVCSCSVASGCCNNPSAGHLRFETKLFKREEEEQTVNHRLLRRVEVVIQQINLELAQDLIKCSGIIESHQHYTLLFIKPVKEKKTKLKHLANSNKCHVIFILGAIYFIEIH